MTERDEPWTPGTPCWTDLMTSDVEAARSFYGSLFGWQMQVGPPDTGGYTMAEVGGRTVAGIGALPPDSKAPTLWATYLATADADATAAAVTAAGGTLYQEPFDVMAFGRMGVAADPAGAPFGFWQAGEHVGATLANEPNSMMWNECMSRDYEAAMDFYAAVFGYTYTDMSAENAQYSTIEVNGQMVGGIGALTAEAPAGVPSHWMVYFAVEDTDATVDSATNLGASVARAAVDSPYGRLAVLRDAQGATFSVITAAPPS